MNRRLRRLGFLVSIVVALGVLAWLNREWLEAQLYLSCMESADRVEGLQVERVIEKLNIQPGQKIADIGAGTGLFTRPLAQATGEQGRVYAVDLNQELLDHIEKEAREAGLTQIEPVLAAEDDPQLPERVDLIFMCDTLHHIANRDVYLKKLRRYLEPGGRLAIIDFPEESPHFFSALKYSFEELQGWATTAGYEELQRYDFVADNFFIIYWCGTCPDS